MDRDENLLKRLARRNWFILAGLLLATAPWRSLPLTLGVLAGGLVSITGYLWLQRTLRRLLETPSRASVGGFQINYFLRLGALAAALFLLIKVVKVNPIGLAVGLSVVVLNILWTAVQRLF
jgi:hypothetical protein